MGSCCDDGRYQFGNCGGWWYNCKEFGLKNHKDWIRFGRHGLTMPLSTEHQAICKYTRTRISCPMPENCNFRTPRWVSKKDYAADVCEEMPMVRRLRPLPPARRRRVRATATVTVRGEGDLRCLSRRLWKRLHPRPQHPHRRPHLGRVQNERRLLSQQGP